MPKILVLHVVGPIGWQQWLDAWESIPQISASFSASRVGWRPMRKSLTNMRQLLRSGDTLD